MGIAEQVGITRGEPVEIGRGAVTGVRTSVTPTSYGFTIDQEAYGKTTFVSITHEEAAALAALVSKH